MPRVFFASRESYSNPKSCFPIENVIPANQPSFWRLLVGTLVRMPVVPCPGIRRSQGEARKNEAG